MLDHVFKNNAREDLIQRMNDDDEDDDCDTGNYHKKEESRIVSTS